MSESDPEQEATEDAAEEPFEFDNEDATERKANALGGIPVMKPLPGNTKSVPPDPPPDPPRQN
jgi:hypothetical protein